MGKRGRGEKGKREKKIPHGGMGYLFPFNLFACP